MKTRLEVSPDKLRGGFYTPAPLVDHALSRLEALVGDREALDLLEPSAGDGAFLRGLLRSSSLAARIQSVTAVELIEEEAAECRDAAERLNAQSCVINDDYVTWQDGSTSTYDVAVGNPPFVRFQFVDEATKETASKLAHAMELPVRRVSNLWIAVFLGALNQLRDGGAFSFIVPAECFTGVSAGAVRSWLMRHCEAVTLDLFPPASFPGVLQEVIILSGLRRRIAPRASGTLRVVEHEERKEWTRSVPASDETWTRHLLEPRQLEALECAVSLDSVRRLGTIAKFEVAAVTGANAYFSVDSATVVRYGLLEWATPLLPRIRHACGLIYGQRDHQSTVEAGARAFLLDFSEERSDPQESSQARSYIQQGERLGLHRRYKTRIRNPWYRVPYVRSRSLMLSKRSHWYPRVVVNEVGAVTTDTIYRGDVTVDEISSDDFAASFHNSLTLLAAEVEGRSFGGGVLELVPSEVARLAVPLIPGLGDELPRLDSLSRSNSSSVLDDPLVDETNAFVLKAKIGITTDMVDHLKAARQRLTARRLSRNGS